MTSDTPDVRDGAPSSDNPDELFDLVDEWDVVIGRVRRGDAHTNPLLIHRSVQVLVFDSHDRVLLQIRSSRKDLFPHYYCASASGHVLADETYVATAERELREELGVTATLVFVGTALARSTYETEMTALFLARHDGPFDFDPIETDGGVFYSWEEALAARATEPMTPSLLVAFDQVRQRLADGSLTLPS